MRFRSTRVILAAGILALAASAAVLAGAGVGASAGTGTAASQAGVTGSDQVVQSQSAHPGDLYFVSGGWVHEQQRVVWVGEYIARVPVAGGTPQRVAEIDGNSVTGMAIVGGRLYWMTLAGIGGSIRYVDLHGSPVVHTLVGNLSYPWGLVAADGWLYWIGQNGIGRVRPDGAQLTRRFISLPQESGGGVANGLATDGSHLFFSRCQDNQIGRVDVGGQGLDLSLIKLPAQSCPQSLAVGNDHLYWTELFSYVGRATLQGTGANGTWLNIHTDQGPFNVAADDSNVYWDWGGVTNSPLHVGTARVNGTDLRAGVLTGEGAFLLTSPGANS